MRSRRSTLLVLIASARSLVAQTPPSDARQLHDVIVQVFAARTTRPLPVGDTLISWYKTPVLFHTVQRSPGAVASGMVRVDSTVGLARVLVDSGSVTSFEVHWTRGDSILVDLRGETRAGAIIELTGTKTGPLRAPLAIWGVADYGMEDQLLPILEGSPARREPVVVAVYRPFAGKWDTLTVTKRAVDDGWLYELRSTNGKRDWWLVSAEGILVQLLREGQDYERRPLEGTSAAREYLRLVALKH